MARNQMPRPAQSIKLPQVLFEEYPNAAPDFVWRVRIRPGGHTGFGANIPAALNDLECRLEEEREAFGIAKEAAKRLPIASIRPRRG